MLNCRLFFVRKHSDTTRKPLVGFLVACNPDDFDNQLRTLGASGQIEAHEITASMGVELKGDVRASNVYIVKAQMMEESIEQLTQGSWRPVADVISDWRNSLVKTDD